MIAILTRRFILIGLVFALFGGAVVAFVVGKESRHDRSWVAGQTIPCATGQKPVVPVAQKTLSGEVRCSPTPHSFCKPLCGSPSSARCSWARFAGFTASLEGPGAGVKGAGLVLFVSLQRSR